MPMVQVIRYITIVSSKMFKVQCICSSRNVLSTLHCVRYTLYVSLLLFVIDNGGCWLGLYHMTFAAVKVCIVSPLFVLSYLIRWESIQQLKRSKEKLLAQAQRYIHTYMYVYVQFFSIHIYCTCI